MHIYTHMCVLVVQLCLTLCDPTDYSPPDSSVLGILQARILEWVAIPFSRGSSQPGIKPKSPTLQADSLPSEPQGKSKDRINCYIYNTKTLGHKNYCRILYCLIDLYNNHKTDNVISILQMKTQSFVCSKTQPSIYIKGEHLTSS